MSAVNRRQVLGAAGLGLAALPLGAAAAQAAGVAPGTSAPGASSPAGHRPGGRVVIPGADRLARGRWADLAGQRVGVVTNPTGILQDLRHVVDAMVDSGSVDVVAVFGPEHGFRGTAQAGDSEGNHEDPRTGVMVYDAYGATAEKLAGFYREARVETVVFDIQDVGRPVLHLRLDDVRRDEGGRRDRRALRRAGPAEPGRRRRARADAATRVHLRRRASSRSSSSTA